MRCVAPTSQRQYHARQGSVRLLPVKEAAVMKQCNTSRVYLLHFSKRYHHAGHYLGTAADVEVRNHQHGLAHGAKLMVAVRKAGITWHVARTWPGGRELERELKRRHNSPQLCPTCLQERVAAKVWEVKR
jgi:hypothetical protein